MQSINSKFWPREIIEQERKTSHNILKWNRNENETLESIGEIIEKRHDKIHSEIEIHELPKKISLNELEYLIDRIELIKPSKIIKEKKTGTQKSLIIYNKESIKEYNLTLSYLKYLNTDSIVADEKISIDLLESFRYREVILIGINPFLERAISKNLPECNIYKIVKPKSGLMDLTNTKNINLIIFDQGKSIRNNLIKFLKRESILIKETKCINNQVFNNFLDQYDSRTLAKKHSTYYRLSEKSDLSYHFLIYLSVNRYSLLNNKNFESIFFNTLIERWISTLHTPFLIKNDLEILFFIFDNDKKRLCKLLLRLIILFPNKNKILKNKLLIIITVEIIYLEKIFSPEVNNVIIQNDNFENNDKSFINLLIKNKNNLNCNKLHEYFLVLLDRKFINKSFGCYYFLTKFNLSLILKDCAKKAYSVDYYRSIFDNILTNDHSCGFLEYIAKKNYFEDVKSIIKFLENNSYNKLNNDISFNFFKIVTSNEINNYKLKSNNYDTCFWIYIFIYLIHDNNNKFNINFINSCILIKHNDFRKQFLLYIEKLITSKSLSTPTSYLIYFILQKQYLSLLEERDVEMFFPEFYCLF